jgi:uncharacterized protein
MRIENSVQVSASPEAAWELLMDVPRVVPCMPGAELTEVVDDSSWKAKMSVKLGPIGLTFDTEVKREEVDETARRVTLNAVAREVRNRGRAQATIASTLTPENGETKIDIVTDLVLSGAVAQYGRGLIQDISSQLCASFADCLQSQLVAAPGEAEAAVAAQAKPVSGLSLFFGALRRAFARLFGRRSA